MTLAEAIALIDEEMNTVPLAVRDSWRVVRGELRRRSRKSVQMAAAEVEEPITARHHFTTATEDLQKVREEIEERKDRGDGG